MATPYLYGLRDIKIVSMDNTTVVDLPAARQLTFTERIVSSELRGDDTVVSSSSFMDAVEFSLESGGYPMEAIAMLTGRTLLAGGVSPNTEQRIVASAGDDYPYVQIFGRSIGDTGDDVWVHIHKAKLNTAPTGTFQDEEFFLLGADGVGIADAGGVVYDVIYHETAVPLSADPADYPPTHTAV